MSSRRRRSSIVDFEIEQKLEKRYEEEEKRGTHKRVIEWINNCLVLEYDYRICASYSWKDIQEFLEDGTVLCRLMNRLLVQAKLPKIQYRPQKSKIGNEINWLENTTINVELFNEGARMLGVPDMYMLEVSDLVNGRKGHVFNMIVGIHKLGLVANEKKLTPLFEKPRSFGRKLTIANLMNARMLRQLLPSLRDEDEDSE